MSRGSGKPGIGGGLGRLLGGDADAVDAAHLAGADADRRAAAREDDRVRLDVLRDRVGEQQVGDLGLGRRALRDDLQIVAGGRDPVALLDQQPAGEFVRRPALRFRVGQAVRPPAAAAPPCARAISRAAGSASGRDDDLDKDLRDRLGGGGVERAVQRDDAAERADRVAGQRLVPGLAQARADRGAARVGVLDDRDRRLGEFGDQLVGGVGVGVVVVGQFLALDLARGRDAGARCRRCGRARRADAGSRRSGSARRARRRRPASRERSRPRRARTTARSRRHRRRSAHRPCAPDAAAARGRSRRHCAISPSTVS